MIIAERLPVQARFAKNAEIAPGKTVVIRLGQPVAPLPDVPRFVATIIGALMLGVEGRSAAKYSFFAAVPFLLDASLLQFAETLTDTTLLDWTCRV